MKFLSILLISIFSLSFSLKDINDDITVAIKLGNTSELVKLFSDKVSIKVLGQEDLLSKAQAQAIVQDFFNRNTVKNYQTAHSSVVNGDQQFITGTLDTSTGKYRVSILIRGNLISQFRIENE